MAPTYPECDEADLRATLAAIKELKPITIFHEPINIRAENVARIEKHAQELGQQMKTEVFADKNSWRQYALEQLVQVQKLAEELSIQDRLHLWPDADLKNKKGYLELRKSLWKNGKLSEAQQIHAANQDGVFYDTLYLPWLNGWWSRISEWPGMRRAKWRYPVLTKAIEFVSDIEQKTKGAEEAGI